MNNSNAYIVRFENDKNRWATFTPDKDQSMIERVKNNFIKDHKDDAYHFVDPKGIFDDFFKKEIDNFFLSRNLMVPGTKLFMLNNNKNETVAALLAKIRFESPEIIIVLSGSYVLKEMRGKGVMSCFGAAIRNKLFDDHKEENTCVRSYVAQYNTASLKLQEKFGAAETNSNTMFCRLELNKERFQSAMTPEKIQAELEKLRANCPELFPHS